MKLINRTFYLFLMLLLLGTCLQGCSKEEAPEEDDRSMEMAYLISLIALII